MDNAAPNSTSKSRKSRHGSLTDTGEEGDAAVWATFDKSFRQVQSVLDRSWVLIQLVNENHQSKIPLNMVKDVALIQELNGNISKMELSKLLSFPTQQQPKDIMVVPTAREEVVKAVKEDVA